jgi:hypothetical protein
MGDLIRVERIDNNDLTEIQFIPNEAVLEEYAQESIGINRDDTRHEEEISRGDNIVCIRANIAAIGENLGQLAQAAVNVATTNI